MSIVQEQREMVQAVISEQPCPTCGCGRIGMAFERHRRGEDKSVRHAMPTIVAARVLRTFDTYIGNGYTCVDVSDLHEPGCHLHPGDCACCRSNNN